MTSYPLIEYYQPINILGRGSFGVTYLALDTLTDSYVAMKSIDVQLSKQKGVDIEGVYDEINVLQNLSAYPNCFRYIACYYNSFRGYLNNRDTIFIVSEYINGPTLGKYIEDAQKTGYYLSINSLVYKIRQLLMAINYVHQKGYAHNDLKPENIILDASTNTLKLIDFGLSCSTMCYSGSGTFYWMPPEFFTYSRIDGLDDAKAHDIWSLGVIFYQMANYTFPFNIVGNQNDIADRICCQPLIPSKYPNPSLNNFLSKVLTREWQSRPTAAQLLKMLDNVNLNYPRRQHSIQ